MKPSIKFSGKPTEITKVHKPEQNKKGRAKRTKTSNFHVIINSNFQENPGSEELQQKCDLLKKTTDQWLLGNNILPYIVFKAPEGSFQDIESIETMSKVERGDKHDQPHVHCAVIIKHRTLVQLNPTKLVDLYNEALGWDEINERESRKAAAEDRTYTRKGCFVKIKVHRQFGDFKQVIADYLNKNA